jgi:acyl-ACP thioesterase
MESSEDASSVTSSSRSLWICVSTDRIEAPRVNAELYTGITTDTRGKALLLAGPETTVY